MSILGETTSLFGDDCFDDDGDDELTRHDDDEDHPCLEAAAPEFGVNCGTRIRLIGSRTLTLPAPRRTSS